MLGKLLKYDFRALSRVMLPLQGGVILASIMGILLIKFAIMSLSSTSNYTSQPLEELLSAISLVFALLTIAMVFASYWVTLLLVGRHYYQSLLRDEGYLTLTLPVPVSSHLLSKTLAGSAWLFVNAIIIGLATVTLLFVSFSDTGLLSYINFGSLSDLAHDASTLPAMMTLFEVLCYGVVAILAAALQIYVALTVGAVIAKTHKVLAGIGIYVAISVVMQIVTSLLAFILAYFVFNASPSFYSVSQFPWVYETQKLVLPGLIVLSAVSVASYFYSRYLLRTKLNLD
ncbi:MAG: hypothetical protein LBP91_01035 [Coriobacteriales bacterium]|jgi:hypothetical protein|nr:hypothetical protein [Coriobacteriales bacterium]